MTSRLGCGVNSGFAAEGLDAVNSGFAAGGLDAVNSGFAAGCEARLCLAVCFSKENGLCPWYGLWPDGPSPNEGQAPHPIHASGEA